MISRRSLSINAKYAVSEVVEIPVPVSDSLQDLNVVVHSFGKGVGIAVFKGSIINVGVRELASTFFV